MAKAAPDPATGTLLGYARISKGDDQSNALQVRALRAAGCRKIFEEAASGGRWDRPELHRLLDQRREGDIVVVWKFDRLSRSWKDVLHVMERIVAVGAGFRSPTESIDTTTPAGRMMMQMVGAFAEFERAMIRERTSARLAAARAEGRIGGQRPKQQVLGALPPTTPQRVGPRHARPARAARGSGPGCAAFAALPPGLADGQGCRHSRAPFHDPKPAAGRAGSTFPKSTRDRRRASPAGRHGRRPRPAPGEAAGQV